MLCFFSLGLAGLQVCMYACMYTCVLSVSAMVTKGGYELAQQENTK